MADGLHARFDCDAPIALHASVAVAAGELLALVGPSGAGKTTLLRAVAGLYRPAAAHVSLGDEVWLDTASGTWRTPQQRRVGLVFQDYALFPNMSVLDNVRIAVPPGRRDARRARALDLLSRVHLDGYAARRPAELSGGQQQRVALARALAREPRVLLLDEPFSAVDSLTRAQLRAELAALRADIRAPTLLVTHDLGEAVGLADRICVLDAGHVLQTAPPEQLFARPATPRVAELLGGANVFDGEIVADAGKLALAWGPFSLELDARHLSGGAGPVRWYVPDFEVRIAAAGNVSGERNAVPGQVTAITPLGDRHACTVQCEAGAIRVVVPRGTSRPRPSVGDTLTLVLPRAAIHVMASAGG